MASKAANKKITDVFFRELKCHRVRSEIRICV